MAAQAMLMTRGGRAPWRAACIYHGEMAARAMYKAVLRLGEWNVPVKLFAAASDRRVHFRLLHAPDKVPVKQRLVDPSSGRPVPKEDQRRALRMGSEHIVVLTNEDQAALEPEPTRNIDILQVVPASSVTHQWYERPYYLGPDGSEERYFALAEALASDHHLAITRWVMRKKEYRGALAAHGGYLALIALRHQDEVVDARDLPVPAGRKLDARELQMAAQLVGLLSDRFDPGAFVDDHRERVLDYLQQKAQGKAIKGRPTRTKGAADHSLRDALSASLRAAKGKHVA